jgi:hypothetical protein
MTYKMLQHIPLKSAYLCQDCSSVGNCSVRCPACASEAVMGLSAILEREIVEERKPVVQMTPVSFPQYTARVA